jgi:hypothetical protein
VGFVIRANVATAGSLRVLNKPENSNVDQLADCPLKRLGGF